MRKVVAQLFISLDGVTESPNLWQDNFDEEMGAALQANMDQTDAMLLGRVSYQEWAAYWPTASDEPFASYINHTLKYVVSTTLDQVEWGNFGTISLIKGNLAEAVTKLKQQPGKNISVGGSPTLLRSLLQNNLLDELQLMIHPVTVGHGKRLFRDGDDLRRLELVEAKPTSTGTIIATYRPTTSNRTV